MDTNKLYSLIGLKIDDYEFIGSRDFESMISTKLGLYGSIRRQVKVLNRGDGRKGKIDIVFNYKGEEYAIEIDRKSARSKSVFKVTNYNNNVSFVMTRSPLKIFEYLPTQGK